MQKPSEQQEINVILRPVLGIQPGVYLVVIYSIIILFVLFMLLLYPGIRSDGSLVSFRSTPERAAVYIDSKYYGTTPFRSHVPKGRVSISIQKPFYKAYLADTDIRGRIFGSLFLPRKQQIAVTLKTEDLQELLDWFLVDFSENPQMPEILREASQAASVHTNSDSKDRIYDFLENSLFFITSDRQLRELVSAFSRVGSSGSILSAGSLSEIVQKIIQVKNKYQYFHYWLAAVVSDSVRDNLISSDWFEARHQRYIDSISAAGEPQLKQGGILSSFFIDTIRFRFVPEGSFLMGKQMPLQMLKQRIDYNLPHRVSTPSFFISEYEITCSQYSQFVSENPFWKPSNKSDLIQQDMVDENYLKEWENDSPPAGCENLPVAYVSYYAADSFCKWLSEKSTALLSNYPDFVVRLPSEREWERAARGTLSGMLFSTGNEAGQSVFFDDGIQGPQPVGISGPNGFGLYDFSGNLWEWCIDWFSPVKYFFSTNADTFLPQGSERVVRGGSWANEKELVNVYVRGSQPSKWCTPYLGFRVVLAKASL